MTKFYISCEDLQDYRETLSFLNYYNFKIESLNNFNNFGLNIFIIDCESNSATFTDNLSKEKVIEFSYINDIEDYILNQKAV